jgi:hypothetical protein
MLQDEEVSRKRIEPHGIWFPYIITGISLGGPLTLLCAEFLKKAPSLAPLPLDDWMKLFVVTPSIFVFLVLFQEMMTSDGTNARRLSTLFIVSYAFFWGVNVSANSISNKYNQTTNAGSQEELYRVIDFLDELLSHQFTNLSIFGTLIVWVYNSPARQPAPVAQQHACAVVGILFGIGYAEVAVEGQTPIVALIGSTIVQMLCTWKARAVGPAAGGDLLLKWLNCFSYTMLILLTSYGLYFGYFPEPSKLMKQMKQGSASG